MTSKDSAQDQELLDRYRRASDTDAAAPSEAVRSAILAESRRVAEHLAAKQLAVKESPPPFDVSRPAANDFRWKITAFGTAGAALFAALLIAPRYWESLPTARVSPTAQVSSAPAEAPTAAPAAETESKSANSDAASLPRATELARNSAPPPKSESMAPSRRAEPAQEIAAQPQNAAPAAPATFGVQADRAQTNDLVPAPAPNATTVDNAQNLIAGHPLSADRAGAIQGGFSKGVTSAARERSALEPVNLQSAAAAGDLDEVTLLLNQGAAVDARDALGRTPLSLAVAQNRLEVVRLLLARGADPNAADKAGLTPLQHAKNKDLRDIAALLEQAGAR